MSDWLEMGGYARFVWGSFGATFTVLIWNVLAPRWRRRDILRRMVEGSGEMDE